MRSCGDAEFEAGKELALAELQQAQLEAKNGRMKKSVALSVYRQQTGAKLKEIAIAKLPDILMASMTSRGRSEGWNKWKLQAVKKFAAWCSDQKIRNVLDVSKEVANAYLQALYTSTDETKAKTASTVRRVKYTLGMLFDRALPEGAPNPFRAKDVMVVSADGDRQFNRVPLNAQEVERLLTAAREDLMMYDLIVCALSTGLRKGDICRLRWDGVDLKANTLRITTSKTLTELYLPVLPLLRNVLERRAALRKPKETYVFPEAHAMETTNTSGITWRIKKLFAVAFAPEESALSPEAAASRKKMLEGSMPAVIDAVEAAPMQQAKKRKVVEVLTRYQQGQNYPTMTRETGISKSAISEFLHEAQALSGITFLPAKKPTLKEIVKDVTRVDRETGVRRASKYDFHALRTTFVTLALSAGIGIEILKALTGHATVEIVMRHYFKPRGSDFADQLTQAMPKVLTAPEDADAAQVIPKNVSKALRFIESLHLTAKERAALRTMI
jgi:integrase